VVSTHLKNVSQSRSFPQVGVNIKNLWNHHLFSYFELFAALRQRSFGMQWDLHHRFLSTHSPQPPLLFFYKFPRVPNNKVMNISCRIEANRKFWNFFQQTSEVPPPTSSIQGFFCCLCPERAAIWRKLSLPQAFNWTESTDTQILQGSNIWNQHKLHALLVDGSEIPKHQRNWMYKTLSIMGYTINIPINWCRISASIKGNSLKTNIDLNHIWLTRTIGTWMTPVLSLRLIRKRCLKSMLLYIIITHAPIHTARINVHVRTQL